MSIDHPHIIGLIRASRGNLGKLLSDFSGFGAMAEMIEKSIRNTAQRIRKVTFERMMEEERYKMMEENIIVMDGAHPNEAELQTARKLAKTDEYYLVFPSDGQLKEVRRLTNEPGKKRNDVYLIDKLTFKTIIVDIKTCGNPSVETIIAHLSEGVNQAPNLILDITGRMSKAKLTLGLRRGWSRSLRTLYLNYHGQWYLLDRNLVFDKKWITDHVK